MEAPKQLRKPVNWEDFENLCKKLWGEIWECEEIKKNGRKGQSQKGVDIYGVPKGANSYYGIQCKGKDEYAHKRLTEAEIDRELELVKAFQPALSKFYIVTTANKDSGIEEYIRIKDIEFRSKNLFEIHLFSWEDIVDLIEENKQTYDWYLNLNKYKRNIDGLVTFDNDQDNLEGEVPYCYQITQYRLGSEPTPSFDPKYYKPDQWLATSKLNSRNKSIFKFKIKVKNIGNTPIENPKLTLHLKGTYREVGDKFLDGLLSPSNIKNDVEVDDKKGVIHINPHRKVIVPKEEYISDAISIKPSHEGTEITLNWKLVSNSFNKEGILKLKIDCFFKEKTIIKYVDFKQHVREDRKILDYYEEE